MKKKRWFFILFFILTLYFSVSLFAFDPVTIGVGIVKEVISQGPQPVYSIWDGLEKVKLSNAIDNLSIINDTLAETEKQTEYQLDSTKIISVLLGNSSMIEVIERKRNKYDDMDFIDWLTLSHTDILYDFEDILGYIAMRKTVAQPTQKEKKEIGNLLNLTAGLQSDDGTTLNSTEKIVLKKEIEEDYLLRLGAESSQYGIERDKLVEQNISNSTIRFIEEKQEQLKTIEERLEIAERTQANSLVKQIKYNNQIQILNAQVNLKILYALNLQNEANYIDLINTREERLRKSLNESNDYE